MVFAHKRWVAGQKFEQKDAKIPDIEGLVVTRLGDHLWCKIFRSSTIGHTLRTLVEEVRPSKISDLHCPFGVEQDVLRLDISVDDRRVHGVKIFNGSNDFPKILGCHALRESTLPLKHCVYLAFRSELKDKVKRVIVLIVVIKLDNVLVVELVHDFDFELNLFYKVMLYDLGLVDDLNCVNIL